jgi:DNA-directed RNA polymerase alpha subunit
MLTNELAGQFSRRIEIALLASNFDLARAIISEAERTSTATPEVVSLDDHIACLNCSMRVTNALEAAGFKTIREVLAMQRERLMELPNIREGGVAEIMAAARLLVEGE